MTEQEAIALAIMMARARHACDELLQHRAALSAFGRSDYDALLQGCSLVSKACRAIREGAMGTAEEWARAASLFAQWKP